MTIDALSAALSFEQDPWIVLRGERVISSGRAEAPVTGGNLTTLCHLIGTPFQPDLKGHLLLLEERGEACYRIDRMLTQIRLAGCLDGIAGVLLGSFEDCGSEIDIIKVITDCFADQAIPIAAGFRIGHGADNVTIPLGLPAVLDADRALVQFTNPYGPSHMP